MLDEMNLTTNTTRIERALHYAQSDHHTILVQYLEEYLKALQSAPKTPAPDHPNLKL
ncbi:MAG: hypothetical protein ACPG5T_04740 [Endozoicomonas sp.]